jgi:hypothetical protein
MTVWEYCRHVKCIFGSKFDFYSDISINISKRSYCQMYSFDHRGKKSILLSLNLFSNLSKRISNLLLISKAFLEFLESKSKQQLLVEVSYYDQIKKWLLHYILSFNSNHWKKGNLIKYSRDSLNDYSLAAFQSELKTICLWCFI